MHDIRHHNRHLWLIAQDFLTLLSNLFGAPQVLAEQHALTRKAWSHCAAWLRAGEALMRLLLLIEAAKFAKPNLQSEARNKRVRARRLMGFCADAPEAWRVSFRVMGRAQSHASATPNHAHAPPHAQSQAPRTQRRTAAHLRSAWPLAERAEALLRVFNDPAPFARRLAAKLHATPNLAMKVFAYTEDARAMIGEEDFEQIRRAAAHALKAFAGHAFNTS